MTDRRRRPAETDSRDGNDDGVECFGAKNTVLIAWKERRAYSRNKDHTAVADHPAPPV